MSSRPKIMLDPGHGGHDSGALGPNGLRESDVALSVCKKLRMLLQPVCDVLLTRETDEFIPLGTRALKANDWGAWAFLSVHCNSGDPGSGDGFEVYTTPGITESDLFATDLFRSYAAQFPLKRKRMDLSDGDPDKEARFAVIRLTRMRAALFELEFIHTHIGEDWLKNPTNHALCAFALARGVREYFQLNPLTREEAKSILPELQNQTLL